MELVYSVGPQEKNLLHSVGHSDSSKICSCWSKNNLLAYTWEKVVNGFIERYISILDPNKPWNIQNIPLGSSSVTCLQWNERGMKLLYATSNGLCVVWGSSENLTNVWKEKPNLNSDLHSEVILATAWLCAGRNFQFSPDKPRDLRDGDTREKCSRTTQAPTLTQTGGQAMEGYVVVTPSGILAVKCLTPIQQPVSAKTQLKNVISSLRVADIAFSIDGNIVVMASNGNIHSPVQFWSVKITYNEDALCLSFDVDVMPSVTLECIGRDIPCPYTTISHLCFVSRPSSDHVIICASHSSGSIIEGWLFKEHKEPPPDLHPAFVSQCVMEEKIKRWKKVMTSHDLPKILDLSVPPVSLSSSIKTVSDMNLLNILGVCIIFPNNVIKFLHKIMLADLYTYQISENILSDVDAVIGKKRSYSEGIVSTINHVELSPMSCALSVFDNHGNILMFKVPPSFAKGTTTQLMVHSLVQMLCFCIRIGHDRWDVLLHIDNNYVNPVCDQIREEFHAYPKEVQEMLSTKLLSLEMSIYQRSSKYAEASDCYLRLMFKAISVVFRTLLKPPHNSNDEQSPVDKLHKACASSFETDITTFLQSVDTDQKILQSLQQLIQYVADVALYLVTLLPQITHGISSVPGASLIRNREFLENLRELLVIIQMWKLLKSACAPAFFGLDDNIDWLHVVFKSLTELVRVVSSPDFKGQFPESVVESSRSLCNRVIVPPIDIITPVDGILQRMKSKRPFRFEFGQKPPTVHISNAFMSMHHARVDDNVKVDHLRRIYLGVTPTAQLKSCNRCGIVSMLHGTQGSILDFWVKRFSSSCICGGSWHLENNLVKK